MIAIRPATTGDAEFMLALDALVPGRPRNRAWYDRALESGGALVATLDGKFAGFAIHHRHFFERDFLSLLIVEPWCRRRGVASALINAVLTTCRGGDLFTSTNRSNTTMLTALRRWNFIPTGRIDNIDPGDPEMVFLKRVDPA
jgi:GNAT superfamily N-acetyltransferase